MKTGMFMTPIHRQGRSYGEMFKMIENTILDLDRIGFDEIYLGEHFTAKPEPVSSPLQFYTGLIHRTSHIKFGTGVLNLPHHHPAQIAANVTMFDHMSEGRFIMGIGTGGLPSDFELFGTMEAPRGEMMLESLRMFHEIWASDPPYEISGKFWNFQVKDTIMPDLDLGVMPKPFQLPHPPVVVSAMNPNSGLAGLAGEKGWGYISANFLSPSVLKTHRESYLRGCEKSGRTPDNEAWRVTRTILVTETDEEAKRYFENPNNNVTTYYRFLHTQMSRMQYNILFQPDIANPKEDLSLEEAMGEMVIAGSVDTVVAKLKQLRETIGEFGGLFLAYHDRDDDPAMWEKSYRLYKEKVIPALVDQGF
jgi:alkanesulfonate monooxygenase SsuD/methylene tetrahydromethanopterin reductase-like flavin-dependent oxidoreductase (luciferase family)